MLGGAQLAAGHNTFRLSHGAEITTEANPKPTSPELFDGLLVAGYTPGVAGHADRASGARGAGSGAFTRPGGGRRPRGQAAGFDHHNLDLIYGTPEGERHDLTRLVGAAIGPGTGDISACALVVEDGNRAGPPRSRAHRPGGGMSRIPTLMRSTWPRRRGPFRLRAAASWRSCISFNVISYSRNTTPKTSALVVVVKLNKCGDPLKSHDKIRYDNREIVRRRSQTYLGVSMSRWH